jgi:hypothetical protein
MKTSFYLFFIFIISLIGCSREGENIITPPNEATPNNIKKKINEKLHLVNPMKYKDVIIKYDYSAESRKYIEELISKDLANRSKSNNGIKNSHSIQADSRIWPSCISWAYRNSWEMDWAHMGSRSSAAWDGLERYPVQYISVETDIHRDGSEFLYGFCDGVNIDYAELDGTVFDNGVTYLYQVYGTHYIHNYDPDDGDKCINYRRTTYAELP